MANGDEAGQRWAKELVERVGRAIKGARGGRSAAWLSDRTDELGYRVSPTVIAKLDSGHRGTVLSVAELIVLAAALDTSPVALLYGSALADGQIPTLPHVPATAAEALMWHSGLGASLATDSEGYRRANHPVFLVHNRNAIVEMSKSLTERTDDPKLIEFALSQRRKVNAELSDAGLIVDEDA